MDRRGIINRVIIAAVTYGVMGTCAGVSYAGFALYDDFSGPRIDPEKWRGQESFNAGDNPNAEALRRIEKGQLHVSLATYGETFTNTGGQQGRFGLKLTNPELVTAIQVQVTVKSAVAQACATNNTSSRVRAQSIGYFFNDGSSLRLSDATGDVYAFIQKVRDSVSGDRIEAGITRCNHFDCFSTTTIAFAVFSTPWALNVPDTLEIVWDPANDQFRFRVITSTRQQESQTLSYAGILTDDDPPQQNDFKRIVVNNSAANCTSGHTRTSMDVFFDNVKLNAEAVP